jgi:hypothetical protein
MALLVANARELYSRRGSHDEHDHIGSNSSTPPGAHTPRPDLVDKRLPSLINSYFGQVCDTFRSRPISANGPRNSTIPSTNVEKMEIGPAQQRSNGLPTAPASPTDGGLEGQDLPTLPSHERVHPPKSAPYPTPPTSSSSSIHRASKGDASGGTSASDLGSAARTGSTQEGKSELGSSPQSVRRHTFAMNSPLSNVVAAPTVTPHISNPVTDLSSNSFSSPILAHLTSSRRPSASLSHKESSRLTEGTSVPLSKQATPTQTPPQTPRTRSQEDGKASGAATPSGKGSAASGPNGATIGPVLGKLSVEISEGRGLRSSMDPYVVCQFQCAEYISEGPINEDSENHRDGGIATPSGTGSMGINLTGNERGGRPQAIPMRSRQSSHAGRNMASSLMETTDPKWKHKATL